MQVRRPSGEDSHDGNVTDVSTGGARLELNSPVTVGEQLDVELRVAAVKCREQRLATVCWAALRRDFVWQAGVRFGEPLPDAMIDRLAKAGIIERRRSLRVKVSIPAIARLEASTHQNSVRIANLSPEGIGLVSPGALEIDRRVMISVEDVAEPWTVLAHVRSCKRRRRGHVIGCEFVDTDAYRHVRQFIGAKRKPAPRSGWSRLRDYACGALSAFVCTTVMTSWRVPPEEDVPVWEQHILQAVSQQVERF